LHKENVGDSKGILYNGLLWRMGLFFNLIFGRFI
jgi:hypothetical protein